MDFCKFLLTFFAIVAAAFAMPSDGLKAAFIRQGRQFDMSSANAQASASSSGFGGLGGFGGYPGYFGYPGFGGMGSSFANAQASANSFGR